MDSCIFQIHLQSERPVAMHAVTADDLKWEKSQQNLDKFLSASLRAMFMGYTKSTQMHSVLNLFET